VHATRSSIIHRAPHSQSSGAFIGALQLLGSSREEIGVCGRKVGYPSLAARYLEKKTRRFFVFVATPPRSCFPGFTRVDPTIDQNKRPG